VLFVSGLQRVTSIRRDNVLTDLCIVRCQMTAGRAAMAKKNKKKQKAKAAPTNNYSNNIPGSQQDEEDEEDVQLTATATAGYTNTGLSPELESVHLSTTAALNPKNPNNSINADINQLMATAQHLYQQSSLGHFRESDIGAFPSAEEYWASLPDKVQSIIRQASHNLTGSPAERQEALMAIMNSMAKGGRIPGGFPLPDAQALLGLDLSQSPADMAKMGMQNAMYHQDGEYNHGYANGADEDEYGTEEDEFYPEDQEHSQHGLGAGKKRSKKKKKKSQQAELPVSYFCNFHRLASISRACKASSPAGRTSSPNSSTTTTDTSTSSTPNSDTSTTSGRSTAST
jgi:hypothetical protein